MSDVANLQTVTLGGGCFWCLEAVYLELKGIVQVISGYAGGQVDNPSYQQVCSGITGHAEVVEVDYDPEQVSYEKLLDAFWEMHDPTTPNRQGPDIGTQYRSAIFCYSPEQEAAARVSKEALDASGKLGRPIVTQIEKAPTFWRAEEYHQRYFERRGIAPACH